MNLTGRFYWLTALLVQAKLAIAEYRTGDTLFDWFRCSTASARNVELWAVFFEGKSLRALDSGRIIRPPSIYEVHFRHFCSYTVNIIVRSVIIYTLPLYLSASTKQPVDFVLNACALTFIWEFDDLSENRTYKVI